MDESGFLHDLHGVYNLGYNQAEEVQGEALVVVLPQQVVDRDRQQLKHYAQMVSEHKEVQHTHQRILPVRIVYSVQLLSYFGVRITKSKILISMTPWFLNAFLFLITLIATISLEALHVHFTTWPKVPFPIKSRISYLNSH